MKPLTRLAGAVLVIGLMSLSGCKQESDENDTDVIEQRTTTTREQAEPGGELNRVGIDKPSSIQDGQVSIQTPAQNPTSANGRIQRKQTPSSGSQNTGKQLDTNRYGNPVNQQGQLAGKTADAPSQAGSNAGTSGSTAGKTVSRTGLSKLTQNHPELSTLNQLVAGSGLEGLLSTGSYTFLAPSNVAFAKLPKGQLNALRQDKEALRQVLSYHVVPTRISGQDIYQQISSQPTLLSGRKLTVSTSNGRQHINQAHVTRKDLQTGFGVVHVIDRVLLPEGMQISGSPGQTSP